MAGATCIPHSQHDFDNCQEDGLCALSIGTVVHQKLVHWWSIGWESGMVCVSIGSMI